MSEPVIRPVVAGDCEALSVVARRSKAYWGYTPDQLANWWSRIVLVAEDLVGRPAFAAVEPAGPVGFYTLRPGGDAWELDNLWVVPERIGHGIGRMLFVHALRVAAGGGAREVRIDADPFAEAFYLHCGAARRGEIAAPIPGLPDRIRPQLVVLLAQSQRPDRDSPNTLSSS